MASFPPPRPSIGFQIAEPVRKATFNKSPIANQPDASFLVNESTVKDTRNVSTSLSLAFFSDKCENHEGLHVLTNMYFVFPTSVAG